MDCKIVLADDHRIFREGLKSLLQTDPGLNVVGEAQSGIELLKLLKSVECDLAVVDIAMPEMDGLTALKEIKCRYPQIKVLILSMLNDYSHFLQAKTLGASGYLAKEDAGDDFIRAIDKIQKGKMYVSPSVMTLLAERQVHIMESEGTPSLEILTKREKQILGLITKGLSNKNIAAELTISIHTVENHRAHLLEKLNIKNTASLVKYAIGKGLI
ncbi:MAG: response regulator transcription factor [Candidatus Riflebacteria bacterium]|nr:response regulator transcription factor [Candidatus Riflebacteria bacterium]